MKDMKINELKAFARELNIKGWWDMKKAELIEAIEKVQEAQKDASEDVEEVVDVNTNETEENTPEVKNELPEAEPKKKNKREYTYDGKTQNLSKWAKDLQMPVQTLYNRLVMKNWPVEKAFTEPTKKGKHKTTEVNENE